MNFKSGEELSFIMARLPILTTLVLAVLIAATFLKKIRRRRRIRGERAARDETGSGTGASVPSPVEEPGARSLENRERDERDDLIGSLKSQLEKKELQLEKKESQLEKERKETLRLRKELTKHRNKHADRDKNIKAYRKKNQDVRRSRNKKVKDGAGTPAADGEKPKRPGKPVGSNGGGYKHPDGIEPTRVRHWHLTSCTSCKASLEGRTPVNHWDHHIIDMERTPSGRGMDVVITRHVIYRYRCPACGKLVRKDFGPAANMHYGLGFIAFVLADRTLRGGAWRGTKITLYQLIKDERFIPTITTFIDWMKKIYPAVEDACKVLKDFIKKEKYAHVDETGLPKDGDNWWLWIISTAHIVLHLNSPTRGHAAIKDLFDGFDGILISDFWSAYNKLTVEQQKCLAHLVKTLKEIEHEATKNGEKARKRLEADAALQETGATPPVKNGRGRPKKQPEPLPAGDRDKLQANVVTNDKILDQAHEMRTFFDQAWGDGELGFQTPMENRISRDVAVQRLQTSVIDEIRAEGVANPDIERLLKRCEKFRNSLFTYLDHEGVSPDNNRAERDLRGPVIQRKISRNFINETVMDAEAGLRSLVKTAELNGGDIDKIFEGVLRGNPDLVTKHLNLPDPDPPPGLPKP
jgi:hypothetical protein